MYAELAAQIHHGEEQIAKLLLEQWVGHAVARWGCAARDFGAHLGQLLLHFFCWAARVGPVEADARSAILQSEGAVQGGEVRRQPVHDALALARFHSLPALALAPFVQMRM